MIMCGAGRHSHWQCSTEASASCSPVKLSQLVCCHQRRLHWPRHTSTPFAAGVWLAQIPSCCCFHWNNLPDESSGAIDCPAARTKMNSARLYMLLYVCRQA